MEDPASIEARLLGAPLFQVGRQSVQPEQSKRWLVPVYLAAHDRWVSRDELGTLLWNDGTDSRARHNLRQILHALRKSPVGPAIHIEGDRLRFLGRTDLEAFTHEIDRGGWQQAIEQYRAPFVAGWSLPTEPNADAWIVRRREELEVAYRSALRVSADELAHTAPASAARLYERLWRHDVLDEEALRKQLHCLQTGGLDAVAADVARSYRVAFASELDASPDGELAELLHAAESRESRVTRTSSAQPQVAGPPKNSTPFVGRRRELSKLEAWADCGDPRLVSLVGLGGSGKTRLALELAHRATRESRTVAWTSLVEVGSKLELIATLALCLGMQTTDQPSRESLAHHVGERKMLIVIDNAEDLRDPVVDVVEHLLAQCPHVTILVTTRTILGARFEQVEHIEGLSLKEKGAADDKGMSNNPASDAATLFRSSAARRSRSGEPGLDDEAVEQICREVGGMPLAIELIASWSGLLSVEDLLAEVRGDLANISDSGTLRDLPERQRSLGSVLDSTWHRMTDDAKQALLVLAPCVGTVTLSDARALGARLAGLRELVDAAIVHRNDNRLSTHPLIGAYARERAEKDPDLWKSVEARHAAHYLGKLKAAPRAPHGYVVNLYRDLGNLRASLVWGSEHVDVHSFGDALIGMNLIEMSRGSIEDPALTQAIAHRAHGPNQVYALLREVWQLVQLLAEDSSGHRAHTPRPNAEEAKALALEALDQARDVDDPLLLRVALTYLAAVHNVSGEHLAAIEVARRGLRIETDQGWTSALDKLAHAQSCIGEYGSARRSFLRALAWLCRTEKSIGHGWISHSIVTLDLYTGRYHAAERVSHAIRDSLVTETPLHWRIEALATEGKVAASRGELKSASVAFDRALELSADMDLAFRENRGGKLHGRRAHVAILESDFETARRHLTECQSPGNGPLLRGRFALEFDDPRSAVAELTVAAKALPEESYEVERVCAHLRARGWLAIALVRQGETHGAKSEIAATLEHALRRKLPVEILACSASVAALLEATGEEQHATALRSWVRDHHATDADTRLSLGGPALGHAEDADTRDVLDRGYHLLAHLR